MNKETKEALEEINILGNTILNDTTYKPTINRREVLYNYITNLQQEKDKIFQASLEMQKELTSRIYKAIEYINKNKHLSMFADCRELEEDWNYDLECSANDLLNILQNGSDDNE